MEKNILLRSMEIEESFREIQKLKEKADFLEFQFSKGKKNYESIVNQIKKPN